MSGTWRDVEGLTSYENLRHLVEDVGLSQRQIARLLGCRRSSVETAMRVHGLVKAVVVKGDSYFEGEE